MAEKLAIYSDIKCCCFGYGEVMKFFLALPPTSVTNLAVTGVTSTSIEIFWSPPDHARVGGSIVLILHFLIFRVSLCYRDSSDLLPH